MGVNFYPIGVVLSTIDYLVFTIESGWANWIDSWEFNIDCMIDSSHIGYNMDILLKLFNFILHSTIFNLRWSDSSIYSYTRISDHIMIFTNLTY